VEIYTAGFAGWRAEEFFGLLKEEGIESLVDVRLNNTSQLAGFAKRDDLAFFLRVLVGARYTHMTLLAPTPDLLAAYKRRTIDWTEYSQRFAELLEERDVHRHLSPTDFEARTLLLCSEHTPERCHRRLVIGYLDRHWGDVRAVDLT
jgi:uncharacterized protein (DUF488 family)